MKKITIIIGIIIMTLSLKSQEVRTFNHIKNHETFKLSTSVIDSITISNFTLPNNSTGVLINGVVWATCNVNTPGTFASHPSEAGMFYQWNRNVGWSNTDPMINSNGETIWDSSYPAGNSWEPENNVCPPGWRLPTINELTLLTNSGSFWGELNGVVGYFFGNGVQRVFFPAARKRGPLNGELFPLYLYPDGSPDGCYWSGERDEHQYDDRLAIAIEFDNFNGFVTFFGTNRTCGYSVRCVSE